MRRLFVLVPLAVIVGLIAVRLADIGWRLAAPFPSTVAFSEGGDDAYYYFTVGRNLARGFGLTVDGVHWTSGFQPLWGLLTGLFFLLPWERATFAWIYVESLGCWVASAWLLVIFVRRASSAPVDGFSALVIAAFFLGERHLSSLYVNGMETGLHCLLVLGLLVAFQGYYQGGKTERWAGLRLGLISGLAMLARNDVVLLCGALMLPMLLARRWRDMALLIAVGSVLLLPWLLYCQWVVGSPVPQSGIATSEAVRHVVAPHVTQYAVAVATLPLFFFKMMTVMWNNPLPCAIVGSALFLALATLVLRPNAEMMDRASRHCLLALAAFSVALLVYYPIVSAAFQFYERYFASAKILLLILLALLLVQARQKLQDRPLLGGTVLAAVLVCLATNVTQIRSSFGAPWLSHMGAPLLEVLNSPIARDGSRIGMMESGRFGYVFPDRVVNLDGKMNVEALTAIRTNRMVDYLRAQKFDHLVLYGYDVAFFDQRFPEWRALYAPDDRLKTIQLFTRKQ